MRHNKIRKQLAKPVPHFTTAEKLHKRRVKRKLGPSAMRRADRRAKLQHKTAQTDEQFAAEQTAIDAGATLDNVL